MNDVETVGGGGVGRDAAFLSDRIASDSGVEQRRVHKGAAAIAP